ncbi:G-protein coupled receptor GRL101-like isoform X3 [Clavelina lepadiformis]|uniref:G-protein coupled receptor GRL101-like isoform X3 n=1 Tax=Clavelina lepadiformis TaxID=159417 RepID=UPI00404310FB
MCSRASCRDRTATPTCCLPTDSICNEIQRCENNHTCSSLGWLRLFESCFQSVPAAHDASMGKDCRMGKKHSKENVTFTGESNSTQDQKIMKNKTICFSTLDLEKTCKHAENTSERNPFNKYFCIFRSFLIGVFAVIGNLSVIIIKCYSYRKTKSTTKVKTVYFALVLSLSFADLLMGIYSLVIGSICIWLNNVQHKQETLKVDEWLQSITCVTMGMINFVSSQVSVSTLCMISAARLYSVLRPYRLIKVKPVVCAISLVWFCWTVLAVIPILPPDLVDFMFTTIYKFHGCEVTGKDVTHVSNTVLDYTGSECHASRGIISMKREHVAHFLAEASSNATYDKEDVKKYGYFNEQHICAMKYLVSKYDEDKYFTLFVLIFNLTCFVLICCSQIIIYHNTSSVRTSGCLNPCYLTSNAKRSSSITRQRDKEMRDMNCTMFWIVATDFICWVPVVVTSLILFSLSESRSCCESMDLFEHAEVWFSTMVSVLIPINSGFNPILYWGKAQKFIRTFAYRCSKAKNFVEEDENFGNNGATAEDVLELENIQFTANPSQDDYVTTKK